MSAANNFEKLEIQLKISTKSSFKITKMFTSNIIPQNVSKYSYVL